MTDPAIAMAIGAMLFNGVSDLVYKRAALAGLKSHHLLQVQSVCYGLLVLAYGVASGTLVLDRPSLWGAVAGMFAFTGFYNFARSLETGSITVNAPIFRLSFVLTAVLALIAFGESASPAKFLGLGLALAAVWLLLASGGPVPPRQARGSRRSIVRVLVATVSVAIAYLLYKVGVRAGATPAGLLVVQAGAVVVLSNTMTYRAEKTLVPPSLTYRYALPAAVLLAAGFILLLEALARGPASTIVPIAQMGFVVTAALGLTVLREPLTGRKLMGLAAAVLAMASLAQA